MKVFKPQELFDYKGEQHIDDNTLNALAHVFGCEKTPEEKRKEQEEFQKKTDAFMAEVNSQKFKDELNAELSKVVENLNAEYEKKRPIKVIPHRVKRNK